MTDITKLIDSDKLKYAFVFKNLNTGDIINFNENVVVPSASTIKLFIMVCALQKVKEGVLSLEQRIEIDGKYDIESVLEKGNSYSLEELITYMIVKSDNIAANLLIDILGLEDINKYIKSLGINNTLLQRKMIDHDSNKAGKDNYTTAYDLTHFLELLYNKKVIDNDYSNMMIDIIKQQEKKYLMRYYMPEDIIVANKTGNLKGVKNDAGIVYTSKGDYIFTLLTWDSIDDKYSVEIVREVSKKAFDEFINS